jgi:hypothetical protein
MKCKKMQSVAKEAMITVIGEAHEDMVKKLKPNPITGFKCLTLNEGTALLSGPDCAAFFMERTNPQRGGECRRVGSLGMDRVYDSTLGPSFPSPASVPTNCIHQSMRRK